MTSSKPEGKCHLCGVFGKLSWEHVPPKAAYNNSRVVSATQDQMISPEQWDGKLGKIQQKGVGAFTLCESCNNDTGGWYGGEYVRWVEQGVKHWDELSKVEESSHSLLFVGYPLRFLKQVITMFFSVNNDSFADLHPELVKFVLDKNSTELPSFYKIDLVLVKGEFSRSTGVCFNIDTTNGSVKTFSEIAHFPFALQLIFGEVDRQRHGPIEGFVQYGLDERAEVWIDTITGSIATKYPDDYRSESQVHEEAKEEK